MLLSSLLGAGLGGVLRHYVKSFCARALGGQFPWGIFIVNVTGCFAMGLVVGYFAFKAGQRLARSRCGCF